MGRIIVALLAYCLVLGGIYLHRHPVRFGPPEVQMRRGSALAEARPGATALLVRPEPAGEARGFSGLPTDIAWANLLMQEVGSLDVATPEALEQRDLAAVSVVVLPESCAGRLSAAALKRLDEFARGGGVVVFERSWSGAGTPVVAPPRAATLTPLPAALVDSMTGAGLVATRVRLYPTPLSPPAGARVLVSARAADAPGPEPLAAIESAGAGGFVYVAFPLGRQLLIWQQGLPEEDFSVPQRWRAEAGVTLRQTNALVAERDLLMTYFPHADAWERLVMALVEEVHPVPRLWYFPFRYDGVYSMSHDDEDFGDRSLAITREEARQGYRSTMFIITNRITARGVAAMAATGTEIGLHWWRGWSTPVVSKVGLFGWAPFRRTLSLEQQARRLSGMHDEPITSNRVHGLIWDSHYSRDFRRLEAAGYRLDSSYGPAGTGQIGYIFGTGFPFHPVDTDGRPFRLHEVPFLFEDDEKWFPDLDRRLVGDSQRSFHECVVPLYHCTTMYWKPSEALMQGWLSAASTARAANHWLAPMEEYLAYWEARNEVAIARQPGTDGFTVSGAPAGSFALMVPDGARLTSAGGQVAAPDDSLTRSILLMGRRYRLHPLDALGGSFRLTRAAAVDSAAAHR